MPGPSLEELRKAAAASQERAEHMFSDYVKSRTSGTLVKTSLEQAAAKEEEAAEEVPGPADIECASGVDAEREAHVYRLINEAYAALRDGRSVGGDDSQLALDMVRGLGERLKTELEVVERGSVLGEDMRVVMRQLQASRNLLEYWHAAYPKVDGAITLPDGRPMAYADDSLRIGGRAVFAQRIDDSSGTPTTVMQFIPPAAKRDAPAEPDQPLVLYVENQHGEVATFEAAVLRQVHCFINALLEQMAVTAGQGVFIEDRWTELARYLNCPFNLCNILCCGERLRD